MAGAAWWQKLNPCLFHNNNNNKKVKKNPIVYHNKTFYLTLCTGVWYKMLYHHTVVINKWCDVACDFLCRTTLSWCHIIGMRGRTHQCKQRKQSDCLMFQYFQQLYGPHFSRKALSDDCIVTLKVIRK
jgi:hypothetical protein